MTSTKSSLLLYCLLLLGCVSLPRKFFFFSILIILIIFSIFHSPIEICNAVDYEYYYYYEDELPLVEEEKPQAQEKIPDYDLSELVAAWKEYIRDKAEKEAAAAEEEEEESFEFDRRPTGTRRRPSAGGRPRRPSRPDPVVYEEYECEPRAESYRVSDPSMCDKCVLHSV